MIVEVNAQRVRQLSKQISGAGHGLSTVQAAAFMTLFEDELQTAVQKAVRSFVESKLLTKQN